VAVSAGDNLEASMAAHGSGAVELSRSQAGVMNVDIGGGTTKVVICRDGATAELMAIDVGARLIAVDPEGSATRLEPTALAIAQHLDMPLALGSRVAAEDLQRLAVYMVDQLVDEISVGGSTQHSPLLRTPPLRDRGSIEAITVSGGVSEFVYDRADQTFGDLGPLIADELRKRQLGAPIVETRGGIRATVIGASQYTIQVSGSTIYLSPLDVVPIRNVPVVMPRFPWDAAEFSAAQVQDAIRDALRRFDLLDARGPVAIAAKWEGSATYRRIQAFCQGSVDAMQPHVAAGHPLVLVFDSDIGGLVGLHFREELTSDLPIVSIDGVELREFDYVDIGAMIPTSGAVPVVIKSLVFPHATAATD
jgi:ethanolamine utilization protein EutA